MAVKIASHVSNVTHKLLDCFKFYNQMITYVSLLFWWNYIVKYEKLHFPKFSFLNSLIFFHHSIQITLNIFNLYNTLAQDIYDTHLDNF